MNAFGFAFCVLAALLQMSLPRRWAALPLLLSVLYMTRGQVWDVAGANLTVLHIVVAAGLLRVWIRGEGRPTDCAASTAYAVVGCAAARY